MRASAVVKGEVAGQRLVDILGSLVGMQVDLLTFIGTTRWLDDEKLDGRAEFVIARGAMRYDSAVPSGTGLRPPGLRRSRC
jgi:hypothetical protein